MRFPRIPTPVYLAVMVAAAALLVGAKPDRTTLLERDVRKLNRYLTLSAKMNAITMRLLSVDPRLAATLADPTGKEPEGTIAGMLTNDEVCIALTRCEELIENAMKYLKEKIAEYEASGATAALEQAKGQLAALAPHAAIIKELRSLIDEEATAERTAGGDTSMVAVGTNCATAQSELLSLEETLEELSLTTAIAGG